MLLDKFEYVIAVAEERSLTKAAQRLFVSQPTLSLYISRLEEELGAKLFDRGKSPITITEVGQFYIEKMKQIALAEKSLRYDLQFISHPARSLLIGTGQYRGSHLIPMILPRFCKLYPDVNIQVLQQGEDMIYEQLLQQRIDLAVGAFSGVSPEFTVEDMMYEKLYMIAPSSFGIISKSERGQYSSNNPCRIRPEQLRGMPFIMPSVGFGLYSIVEHLIQENNLTPSRTISASNLGTRIQLSAAGLGITLLSGPALDQQPSIDPKSLDYFIIKGMPEVRRCAAIYRPESTKLDMIHAFLQIMREDAIPYCSNCTLP